MKKLFLILIFAFCGLGLWAASEMSVQVQSAPMRSTPSFLGAPVADLVYGDRVEILEEGRGWMQVRSAAGDVGWVQESALTRKRVVLSAGGEASSGASSDEVALAGKGFNAEIEAEYRSQIDLESAFAWVDRMEGYGREPEALAAFLDDGELSEVIR